MSQFPNTKGQKTMAESDPVVLASDQTISVTSNGEYLATELTASSILSAIQQQSDYETKLVVDSLDVTYLEVRIWNSSTGSFNPPSYYLPNSNTPSTPTPPLAYINPNTYLSLLVSNTSDINLEDTQKLVLTAVTNSELLLTNINNKLVGGNDIGDVTINNGSGALAVNIQDGGNSITVDGTVALNAATLSALESITVQNGSGASAVNIQDGGNSITVDGTVNSNLRDGSGNLITSTTISGDTALDVNIIGGSAILEVNLDQNNDQVQVYGSDLNAPIATNSSGHLQVDILTIPEIEIKNDIGNPIPVFINTSGGSVSISGTVALDTATLNALESTTVQNGSGAAAVNIQDGGNSITVDGTVALDTATLNALESITVQNGSGASAVNIQDGGNSITVDANNLDIRDLVFATDKVDVTNSTVALDTTTLNALENITVQNGGGAASVNIQDGGNSITVDGGTGIQRTPNFLRPSGSNGSTPSGVYSISFASVGTAAAIVGGINLKSGEVIDFDGSGINNTIGSITYDTTTNVGAELIITYLT